MRKQTLSRVVMFFALIVLCLLAACDKKVSLRNDKDVNEKKDASLREQLEDLRGVGGRIEVPVLKLSQAAICSELSVKGELVPKKSIIVKPLMSGRITFLRSLKVGDMVEEGEVIAKLDDRDIEDEIEQQTRQITISSETIKLNAAELAQSEKDLEFDRGLVKKGFLNESELKKSELALERAKISLRQSSLQLEQEENRLKKNLREREKVAIKCPMSGMVVLASHLRNQAASSNLLSEEIMTFDDTLVAPGTELFGIVSQNDYLAQCLVNSKDKAKITEGQNVRVTIYTHKAITVRGEILKIALLQEVKTYAYKIWVRLDEVDPSFSSGLFVRANIELDRSEETIVVPREFVLERDSRQFIQLVIDDKVQNADVTTGIRQDRLVELTSGAKTGDLLIALGREFKTDQEVIPVETSLEEILDY